jgi:uncharacterized protein
VLRIGLISDTHGLLHPGVKAAFAGVGRILHAGDVGEYAVVAELETMAPTTAVRGNTDGAELGLRDEALVSEDGVRILVIHSRGWLHGRDLAAEGVYVVVCGHTHRAEIAREDGVVFVNPGSAISPRGGDGSSVALLTVEDGVATAQIVRLA